MMSEELVPVFRVQDAEAAAQWYQRLGFVVEVRHRFGPDMPLYLILRRNSVHLHLSEHNGDAPPRSYAYFYVEDIDTVAEAFETTVQEAPWAREVELTDPDGNRILAGQVP